MEVHSSSGTTSISITFGELVSTEDCYIVSMTSLYQGTLYIVVGLSWLRRHNPVIDWQTSRLHFKRENGTHVVLSPRNYRRGRTVEIKRMSLKKCVISFENNSVRYMLREKAALN